jgi:hypothetical protein
MVTQIGPQDHISQRRDGRDTFGSGRVPLCIVIFVEESDIFPRRWCNTSRALIAGKEVAVPKAATLVPLPPKKTREHRFVFPETRLVHGTAH